jgi:hypothetical protein
VPTWEEHVTSEEAAATGRYIDKITARLEETNRGRCGDYIYSFGWKDADLDPRGCTGIQRIDYADEDVVKMVVQGYKTISSPLGWGLDLPDDLVEQLMDVAEGIMIDSSVIAYWESDGWDSGFTDTLTIDVSSPRFDDLDVLVKYLTRKALEHNKTYQDEWESIDRDITHMYENPELYL